MIRQSRHLLEDDRELLGAVFEELSREQESILAKIQENVRLELSRQRENRWDIVTALVDKEPPDKIRDKNYHEIVKIDPHKEHMVFEELDKTQDPGNVYCAGTGFLKCHYHEIGSYTDREYLAEITINQSRYKVPYRLYRSYVFFPEEERLERTAAQYQISFPFLYSPMSRRAVLVKVDLGAWEVKESDRFAIDFRYRQNGLENIMIPGKTLVWNVSLLDKNQIPRPGENTSKKVNAAFPGEYKIYKFETMENEYIYVESQEAEVRRINGDIHLAVGKDRAVDDLRYWRICINPSAQEDIHKAGDCYINHFKQGALFKERIRTEGDIRYVLNSFEGEHFVYKSCQSQLGNQRSIVTYDRHSSYHYPKNRHLRSSSFCYVKLEETDSIFFEDWVSYVMAYMNYFYPEFYWVGVV